MWNKGPLLREGKTKRIYQVEGKSDLVIIENKDDITKFDNKSLTKTMQSKARLATETACAVFEVLKKFEIPTAYRGQISETQFLAINCQMINLEIIERRYAVGSFLSRYPGFVTTHEIPERFEEPYFEAFLKTTDGIILSRNGEEIAKLPKDIKSGLPINDPFIYNPKEPEWILKHPKLAINDNLSNLGTIFSEDILSRDASIPKIEKIANKTFAVLERVLSLVDLRLIDFKIEFGLTPDNELVIADVIDNDSWRLRTIDWRELSKELFRQDKDMKEIQGSYEYVARMIKQAIVREKNTIIFGH